jgi:hypothetical protein
LDFCSVPSFSFFFSLFFFRKALVVGLLVDSVVCLGLLGGDEATEPGEGLVADDESGGDGSPTVAQEILGLLGLLDLTSPDVVNMVAALETLVVRQKDEALGVAVQLLCGLADDGEALVELAEGLVAKGVGADDVGRDVLVELGQVGNHGGGEGLVGRVAKLQRLMAVLVGLEGLDAITDDGVAQEVLQGEVVFGQSSCKENLR